MSNSRTLNEAIQASSESFEKRKDEAQKKQDDQNALSNEILEPFRMIQGQVGVDSLKKIIEKAKNKGSDMIKQQFKDKLGLDLDNLPESLSDKIKTETGVNINNLPNEMMERIKNSNLVSKLNSNIVKNVQSLTDFDPIENIKSSVISLEDQIPSSNSVSNIGGDIEDVLEDL